MQLGTRVGSQLCPFRRKVVLPAPVRWIAPPSIGAPQQRLSVVSCAKRSSKRSGKTSDGAGSSDDEASGWDAALSNIPTEDEAATTSGAYAPADADANADASVGDAGDRVAAPDPAQSEPSTSYAPDDAFGSGPAPGADDEEPKKLPSTIITLAEYTMLMQAKEAREREEAERAEREAREAAGISALTVPEPADLGANRQGFEAFALDGGDMELLVSETLDGRLALADCYVGSKGPDGMRYMRPEVEGEVPSEPMLFQVIPWVERGGSDVLKRKEAINKTTKLYFLGERPGEDGGFLFDMDSVFEFDARTRVLARSEVRVVGKMPMVEPTLRIRPSGITIEEAYLLPDPIQVSMDAEAAAEMSEEEMAEKMEELERAAEELDELDEAPDVPGVDMM